MACTPRDKIGVRIALKDGQVRTGRMTQDAIHRLLEDRSASVASVHAIYTIGDNLNKWENSVRTQDIVSVEVE